MLTYTLIRARRKTLALHIEPSDLSLTVKAPWGVSRREIDRFVESHEEWVEIHRAQLRARQEREAVITKADEERWRERAQAELPEKIAFYSALMGLTPTGFRVTGARHRFGSCSGKNSLCFSFRLMAYPEPAIDYVVVHELAHIAHKNHGPQFYALVARTLPDFRERERLLREPPPLSANDVGGMSL